MNDDERAAAKEAASEAMTDSRRLVEGPTGDVLRAHRARLDAQRATRPTTHVDAFGTAGKTPLTTGYVPWHPRCSKCGQEAAVLTFDGTSSRYGLCEDCRDAQAAVPGREQRP